MIANPMKPSMALLLLLLCLVLLGGVGALRLNTTVAADASGVVHAPGEEGAEWWEWCDCGELDRVKITLDFSIKQFLKRAKPISQTMEAWVDVEDSHTFDLTHLPRPSRHSQPRQYQHTNGGMIQVRWNLVGCGLSLSDEFFLQSSWLKVSVLRRVKDGPFNSCKKASGRIKLQTR
mmetsp:Transcript_90281/g.227660  ORF Transcript_90281/g.227660 Transcript_90281/m.227660 type:complete len:176 (+) Transcript_90281:61-588(+)